MPSFSLLPISLIPNLSILAVKGDIPCGNIFKHNIDKMDHRQTSHMAIDIS